MIDISLTCYKESVFGAVASAKIQNWQKNSQKKVRSVKEFAKVRVNQLLRYLMKTFVVSGLLKHDILVALHSATFCLQNDAHLRLLRDTNHKIATEVRFSVMIK